MTTTSSLSSRHSDTSTTERNRFKAWAATIKTSHHQRHERIVEASAAGLITKLEEYALLHELCHDVAEDLCWMDDLMRSLEAELADGNEHIDAAYNQRGDELEAIARQHCALPALPEGWSPWETARAGLVSLGVLSDREEVS